MACLTIHTVTTSYPVLSVTDNRSEIAAGLNAIGVYYDRWATPAVLPENSHSEAVLAAYVKPVSYLRTARGYHHVDVARVVRGAPGVADMRRQFLAEHIHDDDEARFFVEGSGCFYLRSDDRVLAMACTAGDLILIPAGLRHWFDMGLDPCFTAIRLFTRNNGWIARFTGDPIADGFAPFAG